MAYGKRKRTPTKRVPYARRAKRARNAGRTGYAGVLRASVKSIAPKVNALYKMIETKESTITATSTALSKLHLPHNNIYIVPTNDTGRPDLNPFKTYNGTDDPMAGVGSRVGDQISVRGLKIVMFLENALERSKVFYRVMLVRCPRGVAPSRANLFKGDSSNKMIDCVNTERFSIVWGTRFNIQVANQPGNAVQLNGAPFQTITMAGQGTKIVQAWIPGRKFGRNGNLQYENGGVDVKFYDYKLVVLAYDWFGTPQDVNNVGLINEVYTKIYYKDA